MGAHLHPWNTPPSCGLEEEVSMLMGYPLDAQGEKLDCLLRTLRRYLGVDVTSFRAGRFGMSAATLQLLIRQGILADSSVTPLLSWEKYDGPSFVDAPRELYCLNDAAGICNLVEVPIAVGYTRLRPALWTPLERCGWTGCSPPSANPGHRQPRPEVAQGHSEPRSALRRGYGYDDGEPRAGA